MATQAIVLTSLVKLTYIIYYANQNMSREYRNDENLFKVRMVFCIENLVDARRP